MSRSAFVLVVSAALVTGAAALCGDAGAGAPAGGRDAARVELGRRLFFDPAIGRQGKIGCASCHDPEHGFSDARVRSIDETGELPRHSQPLTDLGGQGFHWDGEFNTAREVIQARVMPRPFVAAQGMTRAIERAEGATRDEQRWDVQRLSQRASGAGLAVYYGDGRSGSVAAVSGESPADARIANEGLYARAFEKAFGDSGPTAERIVDALDAYLQTLRTTDSPFDRFLAGDAQALSAEAERGRELFEGRAHCSSCHVTRPAEGGRAPLTDGAFHNTGVAWDESKGALADIGRGTASMRPAEDGRFKTPSLRDVARRPPYMHDGRFKTLEEVVRYYDHGGTPHPSLDPKIVALELTDAQVADLVAFLESLTGTERAGLGEPADLRQPRLTVRVVDQFGAPLWDTDVTLLPAGDRLRGWPDRPATLRAKTDGRGVVSFDRPLTTHARVVVSGPFTVVGPTLVPDCAASVTVVAVAPNARFLTIPDTLCGSAASLCFLPRGEGADRAPFSVKRFRRMPNGRTLYAIAPDTPDDGGRYAMVSGDDDTVVGVFDMPRWIALSDALDAAPAAQRVTFSLDDGLRARLTELTGIGK
jgi:cytochrome c peroxidase